MKHTCLLILLSSKIQDEGLMTWIIALFMMLFTLQMYKYCANHSCCTIFTVKKRKFEKCDKTL